MSELKHTDQLLISAAERGDVEFLHKNLALNDPRLDPGRPDYLVKDGKNLLELAYAGGHLPQQGNRHCDAIVELIVRKGALLDRESKYWDFDHGVSPEARPFEATMELLALAATQFQPVGQTGLFVEAPRGKVAAHCLPMIRVAADGERYGLEYSKRYRRLLQEFPLNPHFIALLRSGDIRLFAKRTQETRGYQAAMGHPQMMIDALAEGPVYGPYAAAVLRVIDEMARPNANALARREQSNEGPLPS